MNFRVDGSQAGSSPRGLVQLAKRVLPAFVLLVASVAISLAAAEVIVRGLGYAPFVAVEQASLDATLPIPGWTQFDRELGWIHRPNFAFDSPIWSARFWPDSTRSTRPLEQTGTPAYAVLLGCSYIEGAGLADDESLGWLLQARLPLLDVRNFGTGGYGSYQSLLSLRRHFVRAEKPTSVVVYALGSFHGIRDRASRSWLAGLIPRGRLVAFIPPHADADGQGALVEFPGRRVEAWRLAEHSALIHLVQKTYVSQFLVASDDERKEVETQVAAIRMMDELSRRNGARFVVATIFARDGFKRDMFRRLERHRIEYADCSPEAIPAGHPDAFWTYRHAACISGAVGRLAGKGQT